MNRPETLHDSDSQPRYAQLREVLRLRIEAGDYPVGGFLPTEAELCAEFGVSRYTVREALRRLAVAGYVQRRQGSGSEVLTARPRQYVHAMNSLEGIYQYASDTQFRIDEARIEIPGEEHAGDLDGHADEPWLTIRGLRSQGGGAKPISASQVFVNAEFASIVDELPRLTGAIHTRLEERYGAVVAVVEQEIRSLRMPDEAAAVLGCRRGAWAVRVLRRYRDADGRILQASVNHHPADRFFYAMRLTRETGGGA